MKPDVPISGLDVSTYEIPTATPESDGTAEWNSTVLALVEVEAGGVIGLGYSYAAAAVAKLIRDILKERVLGINALDIERGWGSMQRAVRNAGRPGVVAMAVSAVDCALWDLKARLLELPLVKLLGQVHDSVPVYGSGGFTSYDDQQLADQLSGWAAQGLRAVKMKIGREPQRDLVRIRRAREAIGLETELMIDANGAFSAKAALGFAANLAELRVGWFEEPVSSDDLPGLRRLRDFAPPGMEIAAGEYGFELGYFRRMLEAQAVDVLQADVTRCGGVTGFLRANTLAEAFHVPLSSHCAPALHLHPNCAASRIRHAEYFFDHVRIERMLFEGVISPKDGMLTPAVDQPGHGLVFKKKDAERYRKG